MERRAVIIVGSGPAGSATALSLIARDPALAGDIVLLDKARHPRDKTCAGGIIPKSLAVLAQLGVALDDVPQVQVDRVAIDIPGRRLELDGRDLCRVVRRRALDASLAWAARDRGALLREDHRVTGIARDGDGIRVDTDRGALWAPIVVGADGSGSVVRRALVDAGDGLVGRGVMVDVPVAQTTWRGYETQRYDFDFRCVPAGVRGYRWVFPTLIDGVPCANIGVYGLPPIDGTTLQRELGILLAELGASAPRWKAFPIRTALGSRIAVPNVMLVGDAAGCDPLMGEGISYALEYGVLAAAAIVEARHTGDMRFRSYQRAVDRGPMGRKLRVLRWATRAFYGRRTWPTAFAAAARSRRAQRIGLAWYNGVDDWDERSTFALGRALLLRHNPFPARDIHAGA